jgi:hypothetical protein
LTTLPPALAIVPSARTSVDAEHEVARRAEPVPQRAGDVPREQRADRRVAGRVEREPLPVAASALQLGEPDAASTVHVRSPGSCSRIAVEPVRRQVLADPQRRPSRARREAPTPPRR